MEASIKYQQVSVNDANDNFEKYHRFKLEDFLRNECILDPQGIERVVDEIRHLYIRTCYILDCQLLVQSIPEPEYQEHHPAIMQYLQQHGGAVCNVFVRSIIEMRTHFLREAARQLAYLDEKSHKRLQN